MRTYYQNTDYGVMVRIVNIVRDSFYDLKEIENESIVHGRY